MTASKATQTATIWKGAGGTAPGRAVSYFPVPYPDELFSSVLMRYHIHSGHILAAQTSESVFGDSRAVPNMELLGKLSPEMVSVMEEQMSLRDWLEKHTMFPGYARFLPKERRDRAAEAGVSMDTSALRYLLYMPRERTDLNLKYCPVCADEDRKSFGEAYWHRMHQVQGVSVCPVHCCRLQESTVSRVKGYGAMEAAAELIIPETIFASEVKETDIESRFSDYLASVFEMPVQWDNPVPTIECLRFWMRSAYAISARRVLVNLDALVSDLTATYGNLPVWPKNMKKRIKKMYEGHSLPFMEMCMVAMQVGIRPEELVNPALPEKKPQEEFDAEVLQLYKTGISYSELAKAMGTDRMQIKKICTGGYQRERKPLKKVRDSNSSGWSGAPWERIDKESLPKVREIIRELEGNDETAPRRITVSAVARGLGTRSRHLENLPQCMELVNRYASTVEENRAKKLVWTIRKLEREGTALSKQRVFELVHMDKKAIQSAVPFIDCYADKDTCQRIRELL